MYGLIILTGCPDGYTGGIYGFQCYKIIIDLSINWNAARDLCHADNAYLTEFSDHMERNAVSEYAQGIVFSKIVIQIW